MYLSEALHLAVTLYPPNDDEWPSTASKPADTSTTSGENWWATGITTVLRRRGGTTGCKQIITHAFEPRALNVVRWWM